jgi:hypothetical protein
MESHLLQQQLGLRRSAATAAAAGTIYGMLLLLPASLYEHCKVHNNGTLHHI